MSKKHNKKVKQQYPVDERSTRKTFDTWLNKHGNDLSDSYGVLSFSGSDGPDITDSKVGWAHFNQPEEVEQFLIEEEVYEKQMVICDSVEYNPPVVHYLDWFRKNFV